MSKVAILIPTMNRSGFVIRQLKYYASVKSPHPIYIGDASNEVHREKIAEVIAKLRTHISVNYYHWPALNDLQTIKQLGETATEPFCAYIGDDDFFIPNSLTKCAEFLQENPEYRTAQGKAILFLLDGAHGKLKTVAPYWLRKEANMVTGRERLLGLSRNYWVSQFSVHRTEEFMEDSEYFGSMQDRSFGELVHSYTFIIRGKSKFIDCLYLIRQCHKMQYTLPATYDWIAGKNWYPSYQLFSTALTHALIEVDNVDEERAREAVREAFGRHLDKGFSRSYNSANHNNGILERIVNVVKQFPCVRKAYNILQSTIYPSTYLSLPVLLNCRSPYHKDFVPIHRAITLPEKFKELQL